MTPLELALANIAAWSLQAGALTLAALALERKAPLERPAVRLAASHGLLGLLLALPLLQPWQTAPAAVSWALAPGLGDPGAALPAAGGSGPATAWWCVAAALLLAAGGVLRLAVLARALARLRGLARAARPLDPPQWLRALRDEIAPRVRFATAAAGAPASCGLWRPLVLLPPAFGTMARERQAQIALHELLHARRRDWLALVLEELVAAVLFFHPGVRWLVARARLAREQCVDALVVARLGGREGYLESLVEAARARSLGCAVPAAPFHLEGHLRERVELLLKEVPMPTARLVRNACLSAVSLFTALGLAAAAAPLRSAAPPGDAAQAAAAPIAPPQEPRKIHHVSPVYPEDAKAEKVEGAVQLDLLVAKDGSVREAHVSASAPTMERLSELAAKRGTPAALEGDARLGEAAVAAVKQWRFEPFVKDGAPVDVKMTVTVRFRLG